MVPSFLEQQVRSHISRARADLRALATALESYYGDNKAYVTGHGHQVPPYSLWFVFIELSFPYISQVFLKDPFYRPVSSGSSVVSLNVYMRTRI